jgi:hypothetical protein
MACYLNRHSGANLYPDLVSSDGAGPRGCWIACGVLGVVAVWTLNEWIEFAWSGFT